MNRFALRATMLGVLALCQPVYADQISDLRAEIAAQKQAAQAQQARLDALEQRLNSMQQAAPPALASVQASTSLPPSPSSQLSPAQRPAVQPSPDATVGTNPAGLSYAQGSGLTFSTPSAFVSLYGLIDVTYVHVNHADAAGDSLNTGRVAWFSGNRWGMYGKRAMGDSGMNVIFRLESEFENQTGNMDTPGVLFNRDAWVGIENDTIGKLTFGRQNAIARDPAASAIYGDPYGSAVPSTEEGGYSNNNNFKQLIFYAGSATGTRLDTGIVWKKEFSNGLLGGAQYQFGGVAGDMNKGSTETVSLAYKGGPFNLAAFATAANVGGLKNRSYSAGGNYSVGPVRLNAGYFHYTADQGALGGRTDNAYTVSAKFAPAGKMDYELGYQNMKANNAAVNGSGNVLSAFNDATSSKGTATGSRATLYGSIFYHFDKITEVYVAADYLKLRDGYRVGATNGFPSQTELALGLRTRF